MSIETGKPRVDHNRPLKKITCMTVEEEESYTETLKFCDELNVYLQEEYNYKKPPAKAAIETINASRRHFEIYLRFKPVRHPKWDKSTLVIARIEFNKTHSGEGTKFLGFLAGLAAKYGYDKIGIESTNKASSQFSKKMGFSSIGEDDWLVHVYSLKRTLKNPF